MMNNSTNNNGLEMKGMAVMMNKLANAETVVNNVVKNEGMDVKMDKVVVAVEAVAILKAITGEINGILPQLKARYNYAGEHGKTGDLVVTGKLSFTGCYMKYRMSVGFGNRVLGFAVILDGSKYIIARDGQFDAKVVSERIIALLDKRNADRIVKNEQTSSNIDVNINEKKEDEKMMNEMKNEKAKESYKRGLSVMTAEFTEYLNAVQARGHMPRLKIVVGDVEKTVDVNFSNFTMITSALIQGKFSSLHIDAVDNMAFRRKKLDNLFIVELKSVAEIKAVKGTRNPKAVIAREASKYAAATIHDEIERHLEDAETVTEFMPNPYGIKRQAIPQSKIDELLSKAPATGIDTAEKFQDIVVKNVIRPSVGYDKQFKIETAEMNFIDVRKFMKTGDGGSYKKVAKSWIFKILDLSNFIIINNVPTKSKLSEILNEGLVATVIADREVIDHDKDGKPVYKYITEEKLFKYVATSASKQRQERYILTSYTDREVIRKMLLFWSHDFDFGINTVVAKAESRVGQNLSTGITIGGAVPYFNRQAWFSGKYGDDIEFSYIIIDDMTVAELKTMMGETPAEGDDEKLLNDGSGFHTEEVAKKAKKKLKNKHADLLQHRLGKGVTYTVSKEAIVKFCELRGIEGVNPNDPIFFITKSMWKFNAGIEFLPITVLRASEEMSEYASMCYETWNALDISSEQGRKTLESLATRQYDMLYMDSTTDAGLIMHRLGVISRASAAVTTEDMENKDVVERDIMEDDTLATALFRFFAANPFYARRSSYLMKQVRDLFARKIADMARGKIMVKGSFCIMMIDPGVWTGTPSLKAGEVYVGGQTGECLLARYPMAYMGEPQVMTAVDRSEFAKFKGLNVIIMNPFDFAWELMQGADFDGDACLVTFEKSIVDLAVSKKVPVAPDMIKKEANKGILNWDSITSYFIKNFEVMHPEDPTYVPTIGKTNNIVAALLSSAHTEGLFMDDKTIDDTITLAHAINYLIDAAKTGYIPPLARWFFETYKKLPNWLAKASKDGRQWTNTWEVETIETKEDSIYFYDDKSPLGHLCNVVVPELFKRFTAVSDAKFNTDDMLALCNKNNLFPIANQIKGICSEYANKSRDIFNDASLDEDVKTERYKELCVLSNEKIRRVAAAFNNDVLTTAVACINEGGSKGFAFKCFEEGIIALFEKLEGVTLRIRKNNKELAEGEVAISYEGTDYIAKKRVSNEVQIRKFEASDIEKEITLRLVGVQYHGVESLNDIKAKIVAAGNIVTGSKSADGYYVANANGIAIGKVYLEGTFAATYDFVMGGTATVVGINPVLNQALRNMPESVRDDAKINSVDLTIKYTAPNGDGDKTPAPTAADESTMGIADDTQYGSADDIETVDFSAISAMLSGAPAPVSTPSIPAEQPSINANPNPFFVTNVEEYDNFADFEEYYQ